MAVPCNSFSLLLVSTFGPPTAWGKWSLATWGKWQWCWREHRQMVVLLKWGWPFRLVPSSHGVWADPKASSRALSWFLHLNAQERKFLKRTDTWAPSKLEAFTRSLSCKEFKDKREREERRASPLCCRRQTSGSSSSTTASEQTAHHSPGCPSPEGQPHHCQHVIWTDGQQATDHFFVAREGHNGKRVWVVRRTDTFDDGKVRNKTEQACCYIKMISAKVVLSIDYFSISTS